MENRPLIPLIPTIFPAGNLHAVGDFFPATFDFPEGISYSSAEVPDFSGSIAITKKGLMSTLDS